MSASAMDRPEIKSAMTDLENIARQAWEENGGNSPSQDVIKKRIGEILANLKGASVSATVLDHNTNVPLVSISRIKPKPYYQKGRWS